MSVFRRFSNIFQQKSYAALDRLEDPSLDLDEAVRLYEEGLSLYERCAKRLDAAELRITQLADALQKQAKERTS